MHPFTGIPARVADLARSRGVRAAMGGSAATGLAAGALPLLEIPGWELGEVSALLGVAAGVALGVAAARREPGGDPSPARAAVAAGAAAAAGVGLLFLAAALRAAVTTPCRAAVQADLFFLTALPSALLGAALGAAAATAARGRRLPAALLAAGAALASLALTLWRGYRGPSAALRDHLLGVWPGPVYDEALAADGSLVLFRLGTLAWAAGLAAAAEALARRRAGRPARGAAALAALGAAGALAAGAAGGDLPSRGAVARALGGLAEGRRCAVHHPREKAGGEAERLLRDCEFAAAEVARALELRNPPRARVFVYRSPDEKRRLVGAGRTSFTKPWLAEIHVNDEPSPRPVLRHELVHALASALAPGPLRVPARGLVLVRAGLVEGLAAGLEPPSGPFTQHQWARAMRDLGLLPPPAAFLGEARFLAAAPARAYAAAGSFVRFLLETRGPSAVARLYASGDLEGAVGLDLAAAARAWSGFLDGVESAPGLAAAAELRFREPPLHRRTCGREQALLAARAGEAARRGRPEEAEAALRRVSRLSGGDPSPLARAGDAWRGRDPARAAALYLEALGRAEIAGGQAALRSRLWASLGDLALAAGDGAAAGERYRSASALAPPGAEARLIAAKRAAAADPALARAVAPWLLGGGDPVAAGALLAASDHPLARYLDARAALARGDGRRARERLEGLEAGLLPDPATGAEARRLAGESACAAGDRAAGASALRALAGQTRGEAERERIEDAARRCEFEEREHRGPAE